MSMLAKHFNERINLIMNDCKTISKNIVYPLQCKSLQKRIRLAMSSDLPVVLLGNPGVGKTELAKKIASKYYTLTTIYEVPKSNVELESSNLFGLDKASLSSDHEGSDGIFSLIAEPNKEKSLILDEFQNLNLELMDRMQTLFDSRIFRRVLRKNEENYSIKDNKLICCMNMPLKSLPHSLLRRFKDINKVIFIALEGVDLYSDEQKIYLFEYLWKNSGYEIKKITKSMRDIVLAESYPNNFQSMQDLVDGFYNNENEVDGFADVNRHYNTCFDVLANIENQNIDFFKSWRAMKDAENQLDKTSDLLDSDTLVSYQTNKEKIVHLKSQNNKIKSTLNLYNDDELKQYLHLQITNGLIDHNDLLAMIEKIALLKIELLVKNQNMDYKDKVSLLKFANIISSSLDDKSAIRQYKRLQQNLLKDISRVNHELLFEYVVEVDQLSDYAKSKFIGSTKLKVIPYDFREQITVSKLDDKKKKTEIKCLETLLADQIKKRDRVINTFFENNNLNGRFNFFDALQNIGKDTVVEWIDSIHANLIKYNTEKNITKFCKKLNISLRRYYDIQALSK